MFKLHFGRKAQQIREQYSHRFIGSRFVLTRKPLEEGAVIDPQNPRDLYSQGSMVLARTS